MQLCSAIKWIGSANNSKPHLISATSNVAGNQVFLNFDKSMKNPTGKQSEFKVHTEKVNEYQQWGGYASSPVKTNDFPFQMIVNATATNAKFLIVSSTWIFNDPMYYNYFYFTGNIYDWSGSVWNNNTMNQTEFGIASTVLLANNDILIKNNETVKYFELNTFKSELIIKTIPVLSSQLDPQDDKNIILDLNIYTGYQNWNSYPSSLDLTTTYKYQCIYSYNATQATLFLSNVKMQSDGMYLYGIGVIYVLSNNTWNYAGTWSSYNMGGSSYIKESNEDIGDKYGSPTIRFAKTTVDLPLAITGYDIVKTSYIKGTISGTDNSILESYTNIDVVYGGLPPRLLSAQIDNTGTIITLVFDQKMADPNGKALEFTLDRDNSPS